MGASSRGLLRATLLGLVVTGSTAAMNLLRSKVSAEVLGPEGFGVAAMASQWVQLFAVVSTMVTGPALISALAKRPALDEERRIIRTAIAIIWGTHAIALLLAMAGETLTQAPTQIPALLLALATLTGAFATMTQMPQAKLIATDALGKLTRLSLVAAASNTLFVVIGTVIGGVSGQFAGAAVGALVTLAAVWKAGAMPLRSVGQLRGAWNTDFLKTAVSLGATSLVAGLAIQAAMTSIRVAVDSEQGAAAGGLFQAAWGLNALVFGAVTGGLGNHAFPRFGAARDSVELSVEIRSALHFVIALALPVGLIGLALHDILFPLLLSSRFAGAVSLVGLLICGDMFRAAAWVTSGPLMYRGRLKSFLALELVGALALGLLVPLLLPTIGLDAIGYVYCGNALLQLGLSAFFVRSVERVELPSGRLALAALSGALLLAALRLQGVLPAVRWAWLGLGLVLLAWNGRRILRVRRGDGSAAS